VIDDAEKTRFKDIVDAASHEKFNNQMH